MKYTWKISNLALFFATSFALIGLVADIDLNYELKKYKDEMFQWPMTPAKVLWWNISYGKGYSAVRVKYEYNVDKKKYISSAYAPGSFPLKSTNEAFEFSFLHKPGDIIKIYYNPNRVYESYVNVDKSHLLVQMEDFEHKNLPKILYIVFIIVLTAKIFLYFYLKKIKST